LRKDHTRVNDNKNVTARPRTRRDRPRTSTSRQRCLKYNVKRVSIVERFFPVVGCIGLSVGFSGLRFSTVTGSCRPHPLLRRDPSGEIGGRQRSARLPSRFVKTGTVCLVRSPQLRDRTHREARAQASPEEPLCSERREEKRHVTRAPTGPPRAAASSAAAESKRDLLSISTSLCISSLQAGTGSTYTRFSLT
jgi:hypothetical protein